MDAFIDACFAAEWWNRGAFGLFLVVLAAGMYILNRGTPILVDDFHYSYVLGGGRTNR